MSKSPEDIYNPDYWKKRLQKAPLDELHRAVFITDKANWLNIAHKHKRILERLVLPNESVLDIGCGWGRLLNLLPKSWIGQYVGVDLSPDFIGMARQQYPDRTFWEGPAEVVLPQIQDQIYPAKFDWTVLVSVRPMIQRNCGGQVWDEIEVEIRKVTRRILYLEYDSHDEGEIVIIDPTLQPA